MELEHKILKLEERLSDKQDIIENLVAEARLSQEKLVEISVKLGSSK